MERTNAGPAENVDHARMWLETVLQDLRYAARAFRTSPLFAIVAILTLAIGIGATTAVFSVVDRLLFRSLPYARADRLVSFGITGPIDDNEFMLGGGYVDWRNRLPPFQSVTSLSPWLEIALGDRNPVRVRAIPVEGNFLHTLGLTPALGRNFTREDDRPNAPRVALISYGLWKSRFGGNSAMLEHTVMLDDRPTRIIGVLPATFELPTLGGADVLLPQQLDETQQRRSSPGRILRTFARLRDGVSIQQARQELQPFFQATKRDVPPELRKEVHLVVRRLRDRQISNARLASWMLFGTVVALLLIACANVANLLLARAAARQRELAMRAALGASRSRLVRQALTESVVLAVCGGIAGCAFAWILLRVLVSVSRDGLLRLDQARLDTRVLLFTISTCLIAALLLGLVPALERPRAEALTSWHTVGASRGLLRQILVTSQIAISLMLLAGASLFVRSLWKLERQPAGLEPAHVLTASFDLLHPRFNTAEKLLGFYNQLEAKLGHIPGVTGFALSDSIPPGGAMHGRPFSNMIIVGRPPLPSEGGMVGFRYVTPGYFGVLHIPLLAGRAFNERDRTPFQNSIVLSARLARRMFGDTNPLGQQIVLSPGTPPLTVVGVAADVKNNGLANPGDPEYYRVRKLSAPDLSLGYHAVALFRTSLPEAALAPWIRSGVADMDPTLPVKIETMQDRLHQETDRPRFLTVVTGLFAAFGLVLAAVGLYGVMAFLVGQQTREIGVRIAIGATPADIVRLVLKHAAVWTFAGAAIGFAGSLALARLARGLLFEISPHDPVSLAIAIAVLAFAAFAASWWPSYRASKVDPALSLRYD